MIEILPFENDDKAFLDLVEQIFQVNLNITHPEEVFIVKVDHWFDFKWRNFSHKTHSEAGVWEKQLRIPPFIPDRIVAEAYFENTENGYERKDHKRLHIYQSSEENVRRKLKQHSAMFLWYSGDTLNNSQASFMVYYVKEDFQHSWYVSFIKKGDWQVFKTDNISKYAVKAMIEKNYLALIR